MPAPHTRPTLTPQNPEKRDYRQASFEDLVALAERNELLLEATDEGLWDWDVATGEVWYSPRWQTMLGYAPGEIAPVIESWWALLHPDDRRRMEEAQAQVIMRQERSFTCEVRLRHKDGSYRFVLARAAMRWSATGQLLRMAGSHQDIEERKAAEARSAQLHAHLMDAQAIAHVGSWRFDLRAWRLYWTPETFRLYGLPPSEDAPSPEAFLAGIPEPTRGQINGRFQRIVEEGEPYSTEYWLTAPDGARRCLLTEVRARRDEAGQVVEVSGTVHDLTERRLFEERLQQARAEAEAALKAKSQFLANMSHEIRTPMNGILGVLGVLQEAALTMEERELLRAALGSGQTLLGLLNDFLDLAKIEAGKLTLEQTPFLLRPLLRDAVTLHTLAAQQKGVALELDVAPDVPESLVGDAVRLRQIIFNLLSNAVKFTAQGHIKVRARRDAADPALLRCEVSDTGVGIPTDRLAAIFDAFTQADGSVSRRFGGTGLGLTICRTLVELMGGALTVESAVGAGATFSFTARLSAREERPSAGLRAGDQDPATPAAGRALQILLAEDNALNARLMLRLLERQGHKVSYAEDGAVAVATWQRGAFDLVLMDVQMPEMDGLLATRTIRALERKRGLPPTPIVALTANALRGDAEACLAAGMDDYLSKPVDRTRLAALLTRIAAR